MKRIDLHIHTLRTKSDPANFDFDINELSECVKRAGLEAIAVTNHNAFDVENYNSICDALECVVFPGIEINVTTPGKYGHVLLIAPQDMISDFAEGASQISQLCSDQDSHISWDQVISIFPDISSYLVIPHYKKKKKLDPQTIEEIRNKTGIDALEVSNNKLWLRESDNAQEPLVVFSDARPGFRIDEEDERPAGARYAYGYTYIEIEELTVPAIKLALGDRKNIHIISQSNEYEILPEALPASKRLNVILGERSSGKTFTLKRIMDSLESDDYFYLKQFSIAERASDKAFDSAVNEEDAKYFEAYFEPLSALIDEYLSVNDSSDKEGIGEYCSALIKFANSPEDDASRTKIFNSSLFDTESVVNEMNDDVKLIKALKMLCESVRRKQLIEEHVGVERLKSLSQAIRTALKEDYSEFKHKKKANEFIKAIQDALGDIASRKPLPDASFFSDYFKYCYREIVTAKAIDSLIPTIELETEYDGKYKKIRTRKLNSNAKDARKGLSLPKGTDVDGLVKAKTSESRLRIIRDFDEEAKSQCCRIMFAIEASIVTNDERGSRLSGGQRAEYVLLHSLSKAEGKDIVLLDEPESSFDNPFLNKEVCALINKISEKATVFLVTHNNTLGVSIHPDYLIYSKKNHDGTYSLYSGAATSAKLKSIDGLEVSRPDNLIEIFEAGPDTYEDRRQYYGI